MFSNFFKRQEYGKHTDIQAGKCYIPVEATWLEYKQNSNNTPAYNTTYTESRNAYLKRIEKERILEQNIENRKQQSRNDQFMQSEMNTFPQSRQTGFFTSSTQS